MRGQKRDKKGTKKGQFNTHIIRQLGTFVPLSLKNLYRDIEIYYKPHTPRTCVRTYAYAHREHRIKR